ERLAKDRDDELAILDRNVYGRLRDVLMHKVVGKGPKNIKKAAKIPEAVLDEVARSHWWEIALKNEKAMSEVEAIRRQYEEAKKRLEQRFFDKVDKQKRGERAAHG